MHPTTAQFLAADRVATLRREAEAERLGRLARPSRRSAAGRLARRIAAALPAPPRRATLHRVSSTPPASC